MTDDLNCEIQVSHQPSNQLQLLVVFLAKDRHMRPHDIEQLRDYRGNSLEMAGSMGPAQIHAQFVHIHIRLVALRIDLLYRGVEQNISMLPFQQCSVPFKVARIGSKVFVGTELCRIHENRDNEAITPLLPIPRKTQMGVVKKSHGRDKDDAFSSVTLGLTPALHLLDVFNDLHRRTSLLMKRVLFAGEFPFANIRNKTFDRSGHHLFDIGILLNELWRKIIEQPKHVMDHEHLTVAMRARADADGRNSQPFGDLLGQVQWNTLQHQCEGPAILYRQSIAHDGFPLFLVFTLNLIAAKPVNRLRRQANVSHDRDANLDDGLNGALHR